MAYPINSNRIHQTGYENGRSLGFYGVGNVRGLGDGEVVYGPSGTPIEVGSSPVDLTACTNGYDGYGQACTDFTPITSNPTALTTALQYLYNSPATGVIPKASGQPPVTTNNMNLLIMVIGAVSLVFLLKK